MKRIARYKIEMDSGWITASALLMGVAFFIQAMHFLAFGNFQTYSGWYNAMFMVIPMVLELAWFVLLKGVKYNACGVFGILAVLFCLVLAIENYFVGSVLQMVLGTAAYLLVSGLALMITGGYFPYKVFGVVAFGGIGLVRILIFDMIRYIKPGDWRGMVTELPALCMIFALMLFFCGITGVREE